MPDYTGWQRLVGATPDNNPGPQTFAKTLVWLTDRGFLPADRVPNEARARVVEIARSFLGPDFAPREVDPAILFAEAAPAYGPANRHNIAWCGIGWLYCLRLAGLTSKTWVPGAGFAYGYLPTTGTPEPGDGAYWGPSKAHHYAVVERVEAGTVYTIDFNSMQAPAEGVSYRAHKLIGGLPAGGCYFSIARLT